MASGSRASVPDRGLPRGRAALRAPLGDLRLTRRAVALAVGLAAAACGGEAPGRIIDYQLNLDLGGDGSVAVDERLVIEIDPGRAGELTHVVAHPRVDTVEALAVTVDGRAVDPRGEAGPGGVVTVPLPEGVTRPSVAFAYTAKGAIAVRGARGVVLWPAVPEGAGTVAEARVRLRWPQGATPMVGPDVEGSEWQKTTDAAGATLTGHDVARTPAPRVYVDLVLGDTSIAEPVWQMNEVRARDLMPAFVSGGLFIAVVGVGVLVMIRLQYPAEVPATASPGEPPNLPDAALSVLRSRRPWRAPASLLDRLVADGLVDADRLAVGRGLRVAAMFVVAVAGMTAAVIPVVIGHLGFWPYAMPLGMLAAALMLGIRGLTFPVLTPAGAEAAMLHSRRSQASPEP